MTFLNADDNGPISNALDAAAQAACDALNVIFPAFTESTDGDDLKRRIRADLVSALKYRDRLSDNKLFGDPNSKGNQFLLLKDRYKACAGLCPDENRFKPIAEITHAHASFAEAAQAAFAYYATQYTSLAALHAALTDSRFNPPRIEAVKFTANGFEMDTCNPLHLSISGLFIKTA